jgi:hypothetical protein
MRIASDPLLDQLWQQQRERIEDQPADHGDEQQHHHRAAHQVPRNFRKRLRCALRCLFRGRLPHPPQTKRGANQARHQESSPPARLIREESGHDRRQRHPDIAEYAVDANSAAWPVAGRIDQHCGTDRVVDRGEQAGRCQRECQHRRRAAECGRHHRQSGAEEKDCHQRRATDALCDPALRKGERAVQHEHAGSECQDRPVSIAELAARHGHGEHRRRQHQQRVMRECVGGIDKGYLACDRRHLTSVGGWSCAT